VEFQTSLPLNTGQRAGLNIARAVLWHRCSGRLFAEPDMTAFLPQHLPALGLQLLDDVFGIHGFYYEPNLIYGQFDYGGFCMLVAGFAAGDRLSHTLRSAE
jgi:hypothetical protein